MLLSAEHCCDCFIIEWKASLGLLEHSRGVHSWRRAGDRKLQSLGFSLWLTMVLGFFWFFFVTPQVRFPDLPIAARK